MIMKYRDVYTCEHCPVNKYCGTMIQSTRLCNSYETAQAQPKSNNHQQSKTSSIMFSKYFYIAKGGKVKVKDTVDLNPIQQVVAQKLLDNINQGVELLDGLDKMPPEVLKAMSAAAAMSMVLGKLSEASKD